MGNRADSEHLASSDWVTANLDNPDIRIVEVGDLKNLDAYASGHIPVNGSRNVSGGVCIQVL